MARELLEGAMTIQPTSTEKYWGSPNEQRFWRSYLAAHGRLIVQLDRSLLHNHGISLAEYSVLVHLSEAPQWRMRMHELADLCGLSPSGLTRRFDSMVRNGLVDRSKCDNDRRGVWAVLTGVGYERLAAATPTHVELVRNLMTRHFEKRSFPALSHTLDRIARDDQRTTAQR